MLKLSVVIGTLLASYCVGAQDLVISNARIIVGNGNVIEDGSILVRDGRIDSVVQGRASGEGVEIDANHMSVMPGYIDAHRHVIDGDPSAWMRVESADRMQEYLDAGFTSLLSAGDDTNAIVELRQRLANDELAGPRLMVSGTPVPVTVSPEEARSAVRTLARANVDVIKSVYNPTADGAALETLRAIVDEANRYGIPTIVHAVTVDATFEAVDAGVTRLVHTPHTGALDKAGARRIATAGIPMTSTLGVFLPLFAEDDSLLWRDGSAFPDGGIQRAGQGPVNARLLWDEGILYGFGTDTRFLPRESLAHELKALQILFSPRDIVAILTLNAAKFMAIDSEAGTVEAGKAADLVVVAGDPLRNVSDLLNVRIVIQRGRVVAHGL